VWVFLTDVLDATLCVWIVLVRAVQRLAKYVPTTTFVVVLLKGENLVNG
jgi:hypothetical protein